MESLSVFLNTRIVNYSFSCAGIPVAFGNFCLTPVRCLFNGDKVTISLSASADDNRVRVVHEKEYGEYGEYGKPKKTWLRVIVSIVLLVPGLLLGSIFKGVGYLSKSIRERHNFAIVHYTPVDRTVGSEAGRLNLDGIRQNLLQLMINNRLNQPTNMIVVYAEPGTCLNEDPGLLQFDPKKIVLVGAQIVHEPSDVRRLDDELDEKLGWQTRMYAAARHDGKYSFVIQHKVGSVEAARNDLPPKKSPHRTSSERLKRVYLV